MSLELLESNVMIGKINVIIIIMGWDFSYRMDGFVIRFCGLMMK